MSFKIYVCLVLFFGLAAQAESVKYAKLNYSYDRMSVTISMQPSYISVHDQMGSRILDIESCNKKTVDKFFKKIMSNIVSVRGKRSRLPAKLERQAGWLTVEGVKTPVLPMEAAFLFFNKIELHAHVLFAESKKLCQK